MALRSSAHGGSSRHPGPSKKRLAASIRSRGGSTRLLIAGTSSYETTLSSSPQLYEPNISLPSVKSSLQTSLLLTLSSVDQSEETLTIQQFQSPFPFTKLPAEIRVFILEIILIDAVQTCVRLPSRGNDEQPAGIAVRNVEARTGSALTLTCKLLYHEGMPTYYGQTTFEFYSLGVFRRFIVAIGPTRYHRISSIRFKATDMLMWQILAALRGLKLLRFELSGAFSSPSRPEVSTKLEDLCRNSISLQRIEIVPFAPSRPMCRCGLDHLKFVDQQLVARMNQILAAKRASGMGDVHKSFGRTPGVIRLDDPIHSTGF